jgi:phosphatidate cytidylyltransferase
VKTRVLTAIVLAPIVLGAIFLASPWPLLVLALVVGFIGGHEIGRMLGYDEFPLKGIVAGLFAACLVAVGSPLASEGHPNAFAVLTVVGVSAALLSSGRPGNWGGVFGLLWIVGPLLALLYLHQFGGQSTGVWRFGSPVLLAILPLWGGDTAAIFAGRAWGRTKLAPKISPNKTVEGGVANLVACVAVAVPLSLAIGFDLVVGLTCGFAAGILGQAGDLFESYVKRRAGLKDSGSILPGHGGVMDRIDSILFTAPAVALILGFLAPVT